jgi:threonine synthase
MATVTDANVHNVAVKGTFDDCQDILKILFADRSFNTKHRLGAVNSINWARILAQTVYYFLTYLRTKKDGLLEGGKKLQFVVPTGNFGDVLAGYYAKRMGVPMDKLVIATNENDILARFWASGRYEKVASSGISTSAPAVSPVAGVSDGKQATSSAGGVVETPSPAMDILVSSNFERLLWYLAYEASGNDIAGAGKQVLTWMSGVKADGRCEVPVDVLQLARRDFTASRASNDQVTMGLIKVMKYLGRFRRLMPFSTLSSTTNM